MLALRLTRAGRPALQFRRLLVALASAGTGFLLLSVLGYALGHPGAPDGAVPRLVWCAVPLAATAYFALAVARTDPATRPRPGLSAVGLGPARLMAISALTTALSCLLGSMLALLFFLHLRGDLTGMPFDGAAAQFLAADRPLPLPAALTLLSVVPVTASATVALALRPRDPRPAAKGRAYGRFGAYRHTAARETFGAYGRFGARWRTAEPHTPSPGRRPMAAVRGPAEGALAWPTAPDSGPEPTGRDTQDAQDPPDAAQSGAFFGPVPGREGPAGLPWGIAALAAGLAVQAYAGRSGTAPGLMTLPAEGVAVLVGWLFTSLGLVLAAPGLTHLCGRLLQSARPGALRLLAGRVLMAEATRIGRPLGVVCAVAAAGYAMTALYDGSTHPFGPLTTLGVLVVTGCTVATLLTAAVEARQCRADTTAALLRLGAPATMLRSAAVLRAGSLLALFGPLTLVIANLAALPLTHR
ncbi:hypothetical protein [Streptomyces sp. NK08204]|uniref:hypothetical protein n=1 Tax=Streptomyces sp. NK08204 TaxID=2873260 RepID=UPI001CECB4C5|nr:hypothetical protein [Streptomyces sp. NK08204]